MQCLFYFHQIKQQSKCLTQISGTTVYHSIINVMFTLQVTCVEDSIDPSNYNNNTNRRSKRQSNDNSGGASTYVSI